MLADLVAVMTDIVKRLRVERTELSIEAAKKIQWLRKELERLTAIATRNEERLPDPAGPSWEPGDDEEIYG